MTKKTQEPQTPEIESGWTEVFLARQPIFDREMDTWGHLLLYRHSGSAERAEFVDEYDATAEVVANLPLAGLSSDAVARGVIHFPVRAVLEGIPRAMPAASTVVVVSEEESTPPGYLEALAELKEEGYTLALDNYQGTPDGEPLAELADILIIDVLNLPLKDLEALAEKAQQVCPKLMAKRIEALEVLEATQRLQFSLFHGYFFKRPVLAAGRKIPTAAIDRLRIFEVIGHSEPDFDTLTEVLQPDVGVCYRLLNFLNSAHFSFRQKVSTVRQAVVLAGWKPVRNWLRVILLTDLQPNRKTRELSYLSAHRAKFLETVARQGGHEGLADQLFTMGLFSLLNAMFDLPMEQVLVHLPLDDDIHAALSAGEGPLYPWLDLAKHIEEARWEEMGKAALTLKLPPGSVADAYRHAYVWADAVFGVLDNPL